MSDLRYSRVNTPVGNLFFAFQGNTIYASMLGEDPGPFLDRCVARLGCTPNLDLTPSPTLVDAVTACVNGSRPLSFELSRFTAFQRAVMEAVAAIPRGEVRTYEEVARFVGHPRAARAVGEVMRTNLIPLLIPCHRVVRAGGDPGNYSPDPAIKRRLLTLEGAILSPPTLVGR